MNKNIFLLICFLCTVQLICGQGKPNLYTNDLMYYSIREKAYKNDVDSIRFVISYPFNSNNPTIVLLQGSGNYPIFSYNPIDSTKYLMLPPYYLEQYKSSYNFVYISKPYTLISVPFSTNQVLFDTTFPNYVQFSKMDFLDYYVSQTHQVVAFLKRELLEKQAPIYLIGISQGGRIAIKYSSRYPKEVNKLVLYSSGIMDRSYEKILELRQIDDCNRESDSVRQQQIFDVYHNLSNQRKYVDQSNLNNNNQLRSNISLSHNLFSIYNDFSFHEEMLSNYLLKLDLPILMVYGTLDMKARDNDIIPFFFIQKNKSNLTILPKLNCNHFFEEIQFDKSLNKEIKVFKGYEVYNDILLWLEGNSIGTAINQIKE